MKRFILPLSILVTLTITALTTAYFLPRPYEVHYHANFGVYIDGKQVDFSKPEYMEETSRCNVQNNVRSEDRIHLHDHQGNLVHVHMAGATWWDLFMNLGWNFGSGYLVDDTNNLHLSTSDKHLYFFINGKSVDSPNATVVKSEDRLLVWYGTGTDAEILKNIYPRISDNAKEFNHKDDPASCSTNRANGLIDLLKNIFFKK